MSVNISKSYLRRVHHEGRAYLAIDVGTEIDGSQLDKLCRNILGQVDELHVAPATAALPVEALGDGMEGGQDDVIVLISKLPQHLDQAHQNQLALT